MSRRKSSPPIKKTVEPIVRNPVAANPLLGKSRAHGKSRKALRRSDKMALKSMPFERATLYFVGHKVVGSKGMVMKTVTASVAGHA